MAAGGQRVAALIDHVNNLKLQYLVELSKLGDSCAELEADIERWLQEHDVVFNGQTIPFVLMPHFVSAGQVRRVRHYVHALCAVLDRFCDAYPTDARLREELAVSDLEDDLIRIEPGFPRPMRICRLDAFLSGYDVKFLEFNADSPAGIGYTDILAEGLATGIDLPRVRSEFDTAYTPILPEVVGTLLEAYSHIRVRHADLPEKPRLALVDCAGSPSVPEFRIVVAAARAAGIDATHATLEEVEYDGTTLTVQGEPTQLVYRRCLLEDLSQHDLVDAARDLRIALVNPLRARVANNKKLLALFQDPRFTHLVTSEEAEVIRRTIPWTRVLRPGRVSYGDWMIDLLPFVADNREKLVLKPASDYGGHGVALGMETSQEDWEAILAAHADRDDFIVQEYVPVPEEMFPTVEDGHVQMRLKRFNINPFGIGGRHAGSITRISDRAVINVSAGGGLLPSVIGRHKRRLLAEDDEQEVLHGHEP
ncbi:MAG: glutathionylspermidine synthase family protein [Actinomycetota bacterium]|nr:glutathionylspermidine synthase family protein [Actinomycetota bacterium]